MQNNKNQLTTFSKMSKKITTVGIIFGGASGEHDVSINSAKTVIKALSDTKNIKKYELVTIYIDKQGRWWSSKVAESILNNFSINSHLNTNNKTNFKGLNQLPKETENIDIWFPVLHGPYGEDGAVQGLLKLTGKPFVGSDVLGSAIGMDKIAMKAAFQAAGLPQVKFIQVNSSDVSKKKELKISIEKIESTLGYPCFIKPANLGSSVGITKAYDAKQLVKGLRLASQLDKRIVVEKSVRARELECAVLGKNKISTSCVGEVRYISDWYDYQTKYSENSSEVLIPAPIPKTVSAKVQELSLIACKAISAEGLARIDFFYEEDKQNLWINEINTLPGFTSKSMFPMLWEASGINLSQLVARLVESATE